MDVGRRLFDEFLQKSLAQIEAYIREGVREDLHLDFKRKARPHTPKPDEEDRRNFARALAGFANSDSGVIIWGVGAPGSGPNERTKHPIHNAAGFAEHLDSLISRAVTPVVDGVENAVIYEDQTRGSGYVVTYVPKSNLAPHRAEFEGVRQYYKRYGDSFKAAEHYELEFMFGRRLHPELRAFWSVAVDHIAPEENGSRKVRCRLRIGVTNVGREIARYACLRLRFDETGFYRFDRTHRSELLHYADSIKTSRTNVVSLTVRAMPGLVIYTDDYMDFLSFEFETDTETLENGHFPRFSCTYDIFAENFRNLQGQQLIIVGKKIREAVRKRIQAEEL